MSRLERTVNLLSALVETSRPLTRSELFKRVPGYEGSGGRRAFERDKELLRSVGVPVSTIELPNGEGEDQYGYQVSPNDYQLDDPGLTNDEISALAIAAAAVRVGEGSTAGALLKLGADPAEANAQQDVNLNDDDHLADLFLARRDLRIAAFKYRSKDRHLEVHRLSFRRGRWYVSGFDRDYQQERTYRVDRMESTVELSDPNAFEPQPKQSEPWLPSWRLGESTPRIAKLCVNQGLVETVLHQTGNFGRLSTEAFDGSPVIEIEYVDSESFCAWVLDFLDQVQILEPSELREEFIKRLQKLVAS